MADVLFAPGVVLLLTRALLGTLLTIEGLEHRMRNGLIRKRQISR
jgi:hypothetical protein